MGKVPKVKLMVQCKVDGIWKKLPAPMAANNRPKKIPGAMFYLRYKRNCWEAAGNDPDAAMAAKRRREIALEGVPGVSLGGADESGKQASNRLKICDAIEQYLADTSAQKEQGTYKAYKNALVQFRESCTKTYLDELERRDLLNFTAFLRKCRKKNGEVLDDRTVYNRFENTITFLKEYGIRGLALRKDWPKYEEEDAVPYTVKELTSLFALADEENFIRYQFFLKSGAREQEVTFAAYTDLDFESSLFGVTPKRDHGFKVKNHEERRIPLPNDMVEILRRRHEANPTARFLFSNKDGNPERKFLKKLKSMAWRGGLNCGHCPTTIKGQIVSCKDKPVCKKWTLHRFRKTFATLHHEAGVSPRTLQKWLGHKSLETTLRYLGIADARSERTREQVNKSFKGVAGKLDAMA